MNFIEALKLLKEGKAVRRDDWFNTYNIIIKDDMIYAHICHLGKWQLVEKKTFEDRIFTYEDVIASDWEEYKEFNF